MILWIILTLFVSFIYLTVFALCRIAGKEDEYYDHIDMLPSDNMISTISHGNDQNSKIEKLIKIQGI